MITTVYAFGAYLRKMSLDYRRMCLNRKYTCINLGIVLIYLWIKYETGKKNTVK